MKQLIFMDLEKENLSLKELDTYSRDGLRALMLQHLGLLMLIVDILMKEKLQLRLPQIKSLKLKISMLFGKRKK